MLGPEIKRHYARPLSHNGRSKIFIYLFKPGSYTGSSKRAIKRNKKAIWCNKKRDYPPIPSKDSFAIKFVNTPGGKVVLDPFTGRSKKIHQ